MKTVYFISGMGADERAFGYLDLSFCKPVFVKWIKPLKGETLPSYAARLAEQIREPEPILVGLSFGGLVAGEIAKLIAVKKLILLSSAKTASEIPFYYKLLRFLPFHHIISASFLRQGNRLGYRIQRMANREDKKLFTVMLSVTDADLLKWSIHQLVHWKNKSYPRHTHQIHGTHDLMIPYLFVRPHDTVRGGTHLMLMNKPALVSGLLKQAVESREE
ncbi:MAG: alpha/beta hydrolase [Williamsia sp.]|nr:alpha/beta hydrolase [Williamsia sp.]